MTDAPSPAELDVRPPRKSPWRNLSVVWLVPVLALAVSLAIAWRSYSERGTLIQITFDNAAGVSAGETSLQYRDVHIGIVEDVDFTANLSEVVVSVRVEKKIAPYLDESAEFWVVRPEVSAEGVSGLSTVLSGVYIEGAWDNEPGTARTRFKGLEKRPLIDVNEKGTRVTLRTKDGNILSAGTPVFYRGVRVGRTETPRLDDSGAVVLVEAFIEAPHDRLLTSETRFWDTSGFSVSFGPGGIKLDVGSFATLISGGVAFNTFLSGGQEVEAGFVYDLYSDEADARENAFSPASGNTVKLAAIFGGGVSGLSAGASVQFEGLKVGEVSTISAYVSGEDDSLQVRQLVTMDIEPKLMGLAARATENDVLNFLDTAVGAGLRARLNTANLFSSALIVEMVTIEETPVAELDRDADPYPVVPSVESDLTDINATLESMMKRANGLKIEELIEQAITAMASIQALAADKNTRAVPEALAGLLNDTRTLVGGEEIRALPGELNAAVAELRSALAAINEQRVVDRLAVVLEKAAAATDGITAAASGAPALIAELQGLAAKARDLKAEELLASATALLNSADALIGSDAAQALPDEVQGAVSELRTALGDINAQRVVERLAVVLEKAAAATDGITAAADGAPALMAELQGLAAKARGLKAEELVASATDLLESADALIGSDSARALPASLNGAMGELRRAIAQANEEGVVTRLADVLEKAAVTASDVSAAVKGAPEMVEELRAVAAKARELKAEELVDSATALMESADALIDSEAARALPADLSASLEEIRGLLAELREGGAVANVNATLASARAASQSLQEAMEGLPALTARLDRLLVRSEGLIGAYGDRSDFNDETLAMLREVRNAARTVNALARALERSPNSLLFGK